MGTLAVAEELDELYRLDATETEPEDGEDEGQDEGTDEDDKGVQPEEFPHG
jgi:hypothetical protein